MPVPECVIVEVKCLHQVAGRFAGFLQQRNIDLPLARHCHQYMHGAERLAIFQLASLIIGDTGFLQMGVWARRLQRAGLPGTDGTAGCGG